MASRDASATVQRAPDGGTFPIAQGLQPDRGDAESMLSSRMTDIVSDDGGEYPAPPTLNRTGSQRPSQRRSIQTSASRPNTGISSQRPPPSRRGHISGISTQRGSTLGSVTGSIKGRPGSSTSRSHVPSISSHAFFRPMSSQRLQAQRGGARPPSLGFYGSNEDGSAGGGGGGSNGTRNSMYSGQAARQEITIQTDIDSPPPPSRGTEMTEQEAAERLTANTSPTQDQHPAGTADTAGTAGSLSESVRPLQRNNGNTKGLSLNIDRSYKLGSAVPTPSKSPHSFRSSFLLPARGDTAPISPNRSTHGREKLSSVASSPGLTPSEAHQPHKSMLQQKLGKNYQYFSGNTVFFWGGRLQNTRHRPINVATCLFVVIPSVLFLAFSAPWLWHNISPAIPIIFAYTLYICISSFFHASLSDPGIIPRNIHPMPPPEENEDPLRLAPPMNDWTMIKSAQSPSAAMEVPTKYCKTCNVWRPPRGHHCRICDNCIETQDHHCVWINNCVGRRNYRYFFTFVTSCNILGFYLLGASLAQILVYMHRQDISFGSAINHFRVPFAMVIYSILATPYTGALMGYHLFLMGRGETTREYLNSHKFLKKDRHRPFTQGNFIINWLAVLCRPRPPTYLSFKRTYEEGDQRFGERRGKRSTVPLAKELQGDDGEAIEMQGVTAAEEGFQGPSALRGKNGP